MFSAVETCAGDVVEPLDFARAQHGDRFNEGSVGLLTGPEDVHTSGSTAGMVTFAVARTKGGWAVE